MRSFAMKTISALAAGLLFGAALAPQLAAAPQFGTSRGSQTRDRVCLYQDSGYRGWEQCYVAGDEVTSLGGRKAQASSIRIFGRARLIAWDDTNFNGRTTEFTSDVPDLALRAASGGHTWNDRISSIRVVSEYSNAPVYNGGRDQIPNGGRDQTPSDRSTNNNRVDDGICVYNRPNFEGRSQCWNAGQDVSDLSRNGNWSDRISSIRVFGRTAVVLYRDAGFRGESVVIDNDVPDLARISSRFGSWDRQISSFQVEDRRGGFPGKGRARGRQWRP
jgi:Peptidase inhibitor family I36